jgi:molybdenum transport protein
VPFYLPGVHGINPEVKLIAAGGLNQNNIGAYPATGVDVLVLFPVYFAPPADIGARMEPL